MNGSEGSVDMRKLGELSVEGSGEVRVAVGLERTSGWLHGSFLGANPPRTASPVDRGLA